MRKITLITLVLCASLCGCARNIGKESLTVPLKLPDGSVVECEYKSEISQTLLMYFTKTKAIDHRTIFSSLTVGEIEQEPDPNSIEALSGGIVDKIMDRITVIK